VQDANALRVSIIEPTGNYGGMNHYDSSLAAAVSRYGADVALFTSPGSPPPPEFATWSLRVVYRRAFGRIPLWVRLWSYLRGTTSALLSSKREGRLLVHFHLFQVTALELFNIMLSKMMRFKIVVTAHDVESFFGQKKIRSVSRLAYQIADGVIAHSEAGRNEVINLMNVNKDRVAVIPHGNYLNHLGVKMNPREAKISLGLPEDAKMLLFFGQIKAVKGLDTLIKALPAILKRHPDAFLCIAGRPMRTSFAEFQTLIEDLELGKRCKTFIRFIEDDEVPIFYSAADLVVLPYRRIYQSGVLLLAMSYGKPVLVSDIPGMLEVVKHAETGFVFKCGDANDLAAVACQVLSTPQAVRDVTESALALMKTKYDWNEIGRSTLQFYSQVCAQR
jgi:D-inositol-3-phosphate glycosyltransferase